MAKAVTAIPMTSAASFYDASAPSCLLGRATRVFIVSRVIPDSLMFCDACLSV